MSNRKSNIELLRIVSMFLIVLSHCCVHSDWQSPTTCQYILLSSLSLGEVGVACFVMITGYFSWKMQFRSKGFLRVVLQVIFYAFVCFVFVRVCIPNNDLSWYDFPLFPIITGEYWFPTAFVALMLLQPFLNALIDRLNHLMHKRMLLISTVMLVIIPFFIKGQFIYSNLLYFIYLYFLGAYIGKYSKDFETLSLSKLSLGLFISFAVFASLMAFSIIQPDLSAIFDISRKNLLNQNSLPAVAMGIFLFLIFRKIDIGSIGFINKVATTAFGVYLISDNPNMRHLVWDWAGNVQFLQAEMLMLVAHILLSVLIVFAICSVIDYLRITLIEKPIFKLLNTPITYFSDKFDKFMILDSK